MKHNNKKDGFLGLLLDTLGASLIGNLLADKPKKTGWGVIVIKQVTFQFNN